MSGSVSSRPAPQGSARRPRLFYLDFVRAFATLVIVLTHFNNPYLIDGRYLLTNQPFGVYVGALGVSLFLIISGAALTYTYGQHDRLGLGRFYIKRFKGIYPMFWIAWVVAVMYYFLDRRGYPPINAPKANLIFTVLGMDGYLANFHVSTAYILGEWFLGFIVLFYIVFPLLLLGVKKYPWVTALVILGLYAGMVVASEKYPGTLPWDLLLPSRLPELVLGMYLGRYVRRMPTWVVIPAVLVLAVGVVMPPVLPMLVRVTVMGTAFYVLLVAFAPVLAIGPLRVATALVARYSYPIFLVHHVVIMQMYAKIDTMPFEPIQLWAMFIVACVLTFALAVALDRLTAVVLAHIAQAFSGTWWRSKELQSRA